MRGKRKHTQDSSSDCSRFQKRQKIGQDGQNVSILPTLIQHPTLRLYYPHVYTLRDYLLSQLPASTSKARVRRVTTAGKEASTTQKTDDLQQSTLKAGKEKPLATLLDKTWVCLNVSQVENQLELTKTDFATFSQQSSLTPGSSFKEGTTPQSEVSRSFTYPMF